MSQTSPRIVLTGGAGFIGSHVAEVLLRREAKLTIIDNFDDFYSRALKEANLEQIRRVGQLEFCEVDICETDKLRRVVNLVKPNVVIHFAARAGVRPSLKEPAKYERINVSGTRNLLELTVNSKLERFLFASSSSVYGGSARVPFREDELNLAPISPYAVTKLCGERLCETYAKARGISIIALRLFSVYGPRQRPDLAIHKFTDLLLTGGPLPIFGDGTAARDYTHVDDIVSGVLAALDYKCQARPYEVFNLGRSSPVRIIDLVRLLEDATGKNAILERTDGQDGELVLTCADISKSKRLLNYAPTIQLKEGLKSFYQWYRGTQHRAAVV